MRHGEFAGRSAPGSLASGPERRCVANRQGLQVTGTRHSANVKTLQREHERSERFTPSAQS
jgi:hypothetical protein